MKTKKQLTILSFLLVLCISIGAWQWYLDYNKKVDEATKAHHEFLASTGTVNGINVSKDASITDKYMDIINDKQMSVNQSIGEHIHLMVEQQKKGFIKNADPYKSTQIIGEWQMAMGINTIYKKGDSYYMKEQYYDNHFGDADRLISFQRDGQMAFKFVEDTGEMFVVMPDGLYWYTNEDFFCTFPNIE
jgi:hypothetical protein